MKQEPGPTVRWWPAVATLVATVLALAWTWFSFRESRQMQIQVSYIVLFVALLSLLAWLSFFARLPGRIRSLAWGSLAAVLVLFFGAFRYRGLTGDFVPLFEPRWEGERERVAAGGGFAAASWGDYPQFLGPDRNATLSGIALARDWSARPPELVWRRPVGEGWSSFAVAGRMAVTQEQHDGEERVVSYDLESGEVLWSHGDATAYNSGVSGNGPRATPTIDRGRVFTLGATGVLNSLDLETGRSLWSRQVLADNLAVSPQWGKSCSPLVVDDLVVVSAGGTGGRSLVAYHRDNGDIVWQAGADLSSYSSPLLTTLAGVRQIIILNQASVVGHDPGDGRLLWSHPWPGHSPKVSQPLPLPGDRLLVSAGYGVGSKLLHIRATGSGALQAEEIWENNRLKAKFTNLVYHRGFVYGLDDGILICLDPETGERRWKRGRYGHGQVILVGDLLIVQTERGEVALVEASPDELRELGRLRVMERKIWNPPALAGHHLLVRNDQEAALLRLPVDS